MAAKKAASSSASDAPEVDEVEESESTEQVFGDTTATVETPDAGHVTDNVLKPDHPSVPHYKSGYAVEKAFYNNPEPAAHARPLDLDPRVNGPFLDEIRANEAASMNSEKVHKEFRETLGVK